jgi:integrase/recombinase XerD
MPSKAIVLATDHINIEAKKTSALIEKFSAALDLRVRANEISKNTALAYTNGVQRFVSWAISNRKNAGQPDTIREWKAYLSSVEMTPATISTWMSGIRMFFRWAVESKIIPYSPADHITGADRTGANDHHVREILSDSESLRLLRSPDITTSEGIRDLAIISVMLYTAVRTVEVYRANYEDVQTRGGRMVLFIQGKGHVKKDAFVVLAHSEDALRDWLAIRKDKPGPLFISFSNRTNGNRLSLQSYRELIKGYMKASGVVGNKTTHSLRHTAITKAITAGVPLAKVSHGLARHRSLDTTMIYVHEIDRLTDPAEDHIEYGSE